MLALGSAAGSWNCGHGQFAELIEVVGRRPGMGPASAKCSLSRRFPRLFRSTSGQSNKCCGGSECETTAVERMCDGCTSAARPNNNQDGKRIRPPKRISCLRPGTEHPVI
jgi:hypothetical protein